MSGIISTDKVGTEEDPLAVAISQLAEFRRPKRILLVEDDHGVRELFARLTEDFNCNVTYAHDGHKGISYAQAGGFDLIILDEVMPGGPSGTDVFREIRKLSTAPPVTFFTGRLDYSKARQIEEIGFVSFIQKPMNPSEEFFASFMEHFGIRKK